MVPCISARLQQINTSICQLFGVQVESKRVSRITLPNDKRPRTSGG